MVSSEWQVASGKWGEKMFMHKKKNGNKSLIHDLPPVIHCVAFYDTVVLRNFSRVCALFQNYRLWLPDYFSGYTLVLKITNPTKKPIKSIIMKRRVRKIANFFAFNLLFFAFYLNFIHKDKGSVPGSDLSVQPTALLSAVQC